jgi:3-isopropylmalate/(R)-2-methylmalate dehydratase small subunit
MATGPIKAVTGTAVFVPGDDIDTDRIIPARFMKCITFDGLGEYLFHDVRKDESGQLKAHALNDQRYATASILLSGNNFGCGSSREHAPQSILRAGYNAVIAGSFAEIFYGNSTNLGIVCVTADDDARAAIAEAIATDPQQAITIDLEQSCILVGTVTYPCGMKPGARESLLAGSYDVLAELLEGKDAVGKTISALNYL